MKPTDTQKEIAGIVEGQAIFWQHSNDINSPTHYTDIETDFNMPVIEGLITEAKAKKIVELLQELYSEIKSIK